jgi:hypothetical protein
LIWKFAEEETALFVTADFPSVYVKFSGFAADVSDDLFVIDARLQDAVLPFQLTVRFNRAKSFEYKDIRHVGLDPSLTTGFSEYVGGIVSILVLEFPDATVMIVETEQHR